MCEVNALHLTPQPTVELIQIPFWKDIEVYVPYVPIGIKNIKKKKIEVYNTVHKIILKNFQFWKKYGHLKHNKSMMIFWIFNFFILLAISSNISAFQEADILLKPYWLPHFI